MNSITSQSGDVEEKEGERERERERESVSVCPGHGSLHNGQNTLGGR